MATPQNQAQDVRNVDHLVAEAKVAHDNRIPDNLITETAAENSAKWEPVDSEEELAISLDRDLQAQRPPQTRRETTMSQITLPDFILVEPPTCSEGNQDNQEVRVEVEVPSNEGGQSIGNEERSPTPPPRELAPPWPPHALFCRMTLNSLSVPSIEHRDSISNCDTISLYTHADSRPEELEEDFAPSTLVDLICTWSCSSDYDSQNSAPSNANSGNSVYSKFSRIFKNRWTRPLIIGLLLLLLLLLIAGAVLIHFAAAKESLPSNDESTTVLPRTTTTHSSLFTKTDFDIVFCLEQPPTRDSLKALQNMTSFALDNFITADQNSENYVRFGVVVYGAAVVGSFGLDTSMTKQDLKNNLSGLLSVSSMDLPDVASALKRVGKLVDEAEGRSRPTMVVLVSVHPSITDATAAATNFTISSVISDISFNGHTKLFNQLVLLSAAKDLKTIRAPLVLAQVESLLFPSFPL